MPEWAAVQCTAPIIGSDRLREINTMRLISKPLYMIHHLINLH